MKTTDNLFTRYFLKSLAEAVDAQPEGEENPVADVESGATNVDALSTPSVGADDAALAGADGDASALMANTSSSVDKLVALMQKATGNVKELESLKQSFEQQKAPLQKLMQNPATREYAEKVLSAIEDSQQKITQDIDRLAEPAMKLAGGGEKKSTIDSIPDSVLNPGDGEGAGAAPAPEGDANPAPDAGAKPADGAEPPVA